jgi:hypothetical protein
MLPKPNSDTTDDDLGLTSRTEYEPTYPKSSHTPAATDSKLQQAIIDNIWSTNPEQVDSTVVKAADSIMQLIAARDRRLELEAAIKEVKNCREGFVVGYQRYEGNEAADKFLKTVISAFDERIAELTAALGSTDKQQEEANNG